MSLSHLIVANCLDELILQIAVFTSMMPLACPKVLHCYGFFLLNHCFVSVNNLCCYNSAMRVMHVYFVKLHMPASSVMCIVRL